jgi:hypothetical protein
MIPDLKEGPGVAPNVRWQEDPHFPGPAGGWKDDAQFAPSTLIQPTDGTAKVVRAVAEGFGLESEVFF